MGLRTILIGKSQRLKGECTSLLYFDESGGSSQRSNAGPGRAGMKTNASFNVVFAVRATLLFAIESGNSGTGLFAFIANSCARLSSTVAGQLVAFPYNLP